MASLRTPTPRRYLMCPPAAFDVTYRINPWMHPGQPVDRGRAMRQWEALVETYRRLGHEVLTVEPKEGLPDMVFAANSAVVIDSRVLLARFRHPQRRGEEAAYHGWFVKNGFEELRPAEEVNEGEGDFVVVGDLVVAAHGFRSAPEAAHEAQEFFGRPVVSLRLVDERFYHLDTALTVLADDDVAYFPNAFSPGSRAALERLLPDALRVDEADALAFGLNATSDGRNVVLSARAEALARKLEARGYVPVPVELDELAKAGGSVKCCTLELRAA
jgi:N-dimethylarginine dimethylaminohydrolase